MMSRVWQAVLAAALIAAVLGSRHAMSGIPASAAMLTHDAGEVSERFRLSSGDGSCILIRTMARAGEPAHLAAGQGCDDIMPGLSAIRFWQDGPDGAVLLSDVRGTAMAAFAEADGAGYESFEPRRPLMSLIPME